MTGSKTALVTGTSSGFGALIALELARRGHRVVATMRRAADRPEAATLRAAAAEEGLAVRIAELDVTDDASTERAVGEVAGSDWGLDVVVNNAGRMASGFQEAFTVDDARTIFETNVFGVMRVDRAAVPHLREQGSGLLVHISSGAGRIILPFTGIYTASKFALEAIAETYRYELAPFGVDSVVVEPGAYETNLGANGLPAADTARAAGYGELAGMPALMQSGVSGGGGADPAEVARAVADLVDTPFGERPFRTPTGNAGGRLFNAYNDLAAKLQNRLLLSYGLPALLASSPPPPPV